VGLKLCTGCDNRISDLPTCPKWGVPQAAAAQAKAARKTRPITWVVMLTTSALAVAQVSPQPDVSPAPAAQDAWLNTIELHPEGGWYFITSSAGNNAVIFGSSHNFVRSGAELTVWLRWEYRQKQLQYSGYSSSVARAQVDCTRQVMRFLNETFYSENNLKGEHYSISFDEAKESWQAAIPGSTGEEVSTSLCHPVPPPGPQPPATSRSSAK